MWFCFASLAWYVLQGKVAVEFFDLLRLQFQLVVPSTVLH